MARAAYIVFSTPARQLTDNFLIDDTFLSENGVTDFEHYRADPTQKLAQISSSRRTAFHRRA